MKEVPLIYKHEPIGVMIFLEPELEWKRCSVSVYKDVAVIKRCRPLKVDATKSNKGD